jgi:hypothetical protein
VADQGGNGYRNIAYAVSGNCPVFQRLGGGSRNLAVMSYEFIALAMFASMMLMLLTGQRVFGAIGFVGGFAALLLWGDGGADLPSN